MRSPCLGVVTALALASLARADEGMWMLHQVGDLEPGRLHEAGLEIDPREIGDPATGAGLAGAAVSLGGCSASFVSPDGLIATNHHCAYRAIQHASSAASDHLERGFLARTRAEEVEARGYRAYVFQGYEEVTAEVNRALVGRRDAKARARALERRKKEIVARCEKSGARCRLATTFGGLHHYLFRTLEIRDIRLVYAPPEATGDFGGEEDNWMWPRHTGDFSLLRAYVGPGDRPADNAPDNVPYRPPRWLRIAERPLRSGDFTMVLGYPGRTKRYRIAAAVEADLQQNYPERIALLGDLSRILEERLAAEPAARLKLASALEGYWNQLKNSRGMLEGLRKGGLDRKCRERERRLTAWIEADPQRSRRYGSALSRMEALVAEQQAHRQRAQVLDQLASSRGASLLAAAVAIDRWCHERTKPDLERKSGYQDRDLRDLRSRLGRMQRELDPASDRLTLRYLLDRARALPAGERIGAVDEALAATGASGDAAVEALLDRLYAGTGLADAELRQELLGLRKDKLLERKDPMIDFADRLRVDLEAKEDDDDRIDGEMVTLEPLLAEALEGHEGRPLYPDANGTLRFTFGSVRGYAPRDGVRYEAFTTLAGVREKNTGVDPFAVPANLLAAARDGGGGRWSDPVLGDVPTCFLGDTDITGGNSGSPVLNGRGELVGLAFDGNWESMTSDYLYDPALTRSISVDVRYLLWYLDRVEGARNLLAELGVKPDGGAAQGGAAADSAAHP